MTGRSDRHSQNLIKTQALEAVELIRRECANVSSRPGNPKDFHHEAEYMNAATFLLSGLTLLQPEEGTIYVLISIGFPLVDRLGHVRQ